MVRLTKLRPLILVRADEFAANSTVILLAPVQKLMIICEPLVEAFHVRVKFMAHAVRIFMLLIFVESLTFLAVIELNIITF